MLICATTDTPVGTMTGCSTEDGICMLSFNENGSPEREMSFLSRHYNHEIINGTTPHLENLFCQLKLYFEGKLKNFSVPLLMPGSAFQATVWKELLKIPFGCTRSYLAQATSLGKPGSVRAVANANGMNRIAIVIPCHRIIGSNGSLTGYAGGLWRKKWLLEHERKFAGKEFTPSMFDSAIFINDK